MQKSGKERPRGRSMRDLLDNWYAIEDEGVLGGMEHEKRQPEDDQPPKDRGET